MTRIFTAIVLGIVFSASAVWAQEPLCTEDSPSIAPERTFTWSPPTTGSPVVYYRFYSVPTTTALHANEMIAANPTAFRQATPDQSPVITITGLTPGWWLFAVSGVDAQDREGVRSDFVCARVSDTTTPIELPDPSDFEAQAVSDTEVHLRWDRPTHDVDAFLIAWEEAPTAASCDGSSPVVRVDGSRTSTVLQLPLPDTSYNLCLCSASSDGLHSPGITTSVRTQPTRTLAYPNPSPGEMKFIYTALKAGRLTIEIVDMRGARVRTLADGNHAKGKYELAWDGTDEQGRPVSSGTYIFKQTSEQSVRNSKFSIVR